MTIEEIKKDIEETGEIISEEMECCKHCNDSFGSNECDGCGTYGNIRNYERQLTAMEEELELLEKIPFIKFLWADSNGTHKVYDADWPNQFITDFTEIEVAEIGGFFIMGIQQKVNSLEDCFKICKG